MRSILWGGNAGVHVRNAETGWHLRLVDLRFLSASVFPMGVLLTARAWGGYLAEAILLSLIASLSLVAFLANVDEVSDRTLMPVLMMIAFIIAYPLRTYFLAFTTWDAIGLGALSYILSKAPVLTAETLYDTYKLGMFGLIVFLITASLLMSIGKRVQPETENIAGINRSKAIFLLWVTLTLTLFLLTGLNFLSLNLGILRMGIEPQRLPFRLGGIISFTRIFLGSYVLLLLLMFGLRLKARWLVYATIAAFLYTGLLNSIVSASRGALLMSLTPPVWLGIVLGRLKCGQLIKPRYLVLTATLIVIFALTHPVVTIFRTATTENRLSDAEALRASIVFINERISEDPIGVLTATLGTIAARVVGVENLIIAQSVLGVPDRDGIWRSVIHHGQLMAVYYTREVMGQDTYDYQLTPGLIGFFWFLGDTPFVIGGVALFTLFIFAMVRICRARVFRVSSPVLVALVGPGMAGLVSEGTLQQALSFEQLLVLLLTITATEVIARLIIYRSRRPEWKGQGAMVL